jgi:hypothetical protein
MCRTPHRSPTYRAIPGPRRCPQGRAPTPSSVPDDRSPSSARFVLFTLDRVAKLSPCRVEDSTAMSVPPNHLSPPLSPPPMCNSARCRWVHGTGTSAHVFQTALMPSAVSRERMRAQCRRSPLWPLARWRDLSVHGQVSSELPSAQSVARSKSFVVQPCPKGQLGVAKSDLDSVRGIGVSSQ